MGIVFALLQSKESRRQLMLGFKTSLLIQDHSTLASSGGRGDGNRDHGRGGGCGGGNGGGQGRAFMVHHPI